MSETDERNNAAGGGKIARMVGYLQGEGPVKWELVEECVSDFPGWVRLMELMRCPPENADRRIMPRQRPPEYTNVSDYSRARLLEIFEPYALLLDAARTPSERALALHQAGYDVTAFCKENRVNGSREIADAAKTVLEACRAEKDLLRGSARPNLSVESLRAAPAGANSDDSLLSPAEAPPKTTTKPGFFARLTAKLKGLRAEG